MGYYVNMDLTDVIIPSNNVETVLNIINDISNDNNLWVRRPTNEEGYPDIVTALKSWRYDSLELANGDVEVTYFTGEKLGCDKILWERIFPYLCNDAEIRCRGEDDTYWRWICKDGKFREEDGHVVYE